MIDPEADAAADEAVVEAAVEAAVVTTVEEDCAEVATAKADRARALNCMFSNICLL